MVTKKWAELRSKTAVIIPAIQVESPPDSSNLNTVTSGAGAKYANIKAQAEIPDANIKTVTKNSDNNIWKRETEK